MVEDCDVTLCKSNALELGRLLAELQTKTNRRPTHGVKTDELNELKDSMNNLIFSCKIKDQEANEARSIYKEAWDAQSLAGGAKMSDAIIRLTDKLYYSISKCDKV